jgi:hypothetical protein
VTFVDDISRQCKGKRTYRTKRVAKRALSRLPVRLTLNRGDYHVYRCPHCAGFHIGTKARATHKKGLA